MAPSLYKIELPLKIKTSASALSIMWSLLGRMTTMTVLIDMARRQLVGEPWKGMPPAEDEKERASREQAGQAVLLYRALKRRYGRDHALKVTGKIILDGSLIFLQSRVPLIKPDLLRKMDSDQQKDFLVNITDRFFNADAGSMEVTDSSFRYRITRCRFPELLAKAGHEELAPLFCAGDKVFFENSQPYIKFDRPVTLAENQEPCDFRFELSEPDSNSL